MNNDKLIAALRRISQDHNNCRGCEYFNRCGPMHCEVAKLAADELERLTEVQSDEA